jgi:hypothetical protein
MKSCFGIFIWDLSVTPKQIPILPEEPAEKLNFSQCMKIIAYVSVFRKQMRSIGLASGADAI